MNPQEILARARLTPAQYNFVRNNYREFSTPQFMTNESYRNRLYQTMSATPEQIQYFNQQFPLQQQRTQQRNPAPLVAGTVGSAALTGEGVLQTIARGAGEVVDDVASMVSKLNFGALPGAVNVGAMLATPVNLGDRAGEQQHISRLLGNMPPEHLPPIGDELDVGGVRVNPVPVTQPVTKPVYRLVDRRGGSQQSPEQPPSEKPPEEPGNNNSLIKKIARYLVPSAVVGGGIYGATPRSSQMYLPPENTGQFIDLMNQQDPTQRGRTLTPEMKALLTTENAEGYLPVGYSDNWFKQPWLKNWQSIPTAASQRDQALLQEMIRYQQEIEAPRVEQQNNNQQIQNPNNRIIPQRTNTNQQQQINNNLYDYAIVDSL